ncbi:ATP-binding cassette domain-containing protein [Maribrevibacterium harenarium]|uniref:ATP-binding cassette domain-containing protein n=1 Tax=Maribrevibacterium harenarium TaxID=2589817 RepID=A0A501WZJ8_9GAMM|nr:ATP-binding cassette domain-containing protein [Maribrevibacterium harenarium]TPE51556.1 ATP-binding cassette domain-containing protein [Maribrevibacterium harenarium]
MSKRRTNALSFKQVLAANSLGLIIAILVGAVASIAGIALLGISGWFLSAAGLAGMVGGALVFDYLTPGAMIRLMAILRTAGRYGEQVFSHDHLLQVLKQLRLWVWDQRVSAPAWRSQRQAQGDLLQRLIGDLDHLIKWPLAVVMPRIYAWLVLALVALFAFWLAPQLLIPIGALGVIQLMIIPWWLRRQVTLPVYRQQALALHRRQRFLSLMRSLVTLTIRGRWQTYAKRLDTLDLRQRNDQARIQFWMSTARVLAHLTTLLCLITSIALVMTPSANGWQLQPDVSATLLAGFVLLLLGANEVLQINLNGQIAAAEAKLGLHRLNQIVSEEEAIESTSISASQCLNLEAVAGVYPQVFGPSLLAHQPVTVTFDYGHNYRLQGASGTGKSTLLGVIAGDQSYEGRLLWGNELLNPRQSEWRRQLAYLAQQPVLFQQTLGANVRLGNEEVSDEEIRGLLTKLGLGVWLDSLPQGLDTLIGGQGRSLSGGQARRIALARVLLRRAPILILDEPFDGLDRVSISQICDLLAQGPYQPKMLIYASHVASDLDHDVTTINLMSP